MRSAVRLVCLWSIERDASNSIHLSSNCCQQRAHRSFRRIWPEVACARLQASKGMRIRQGGPDEDKALAAHILELLPGRQMLTEAAQLCEILILLGHESDAGILQQVGMHLSLYIVIKDDSTAGHLHASF